MKVLVTGASGFIGQHLLPLLHYKGHHVRSLSRGGENGDMRWDPAGDTLDPAVFAGIDAVIHLAGEPVAERWSPAKKERILQSRVKSGLLLARTMAALPPNERPQSFLTASAIGYYGNRGSEVLEENSAPGKGFLPKVCIEWENALKPVQDIGLRTISLRFGIVLSTAGGALPRIIKGMNMSAGGKLGSGQQYMSWITIEDAIAAVGHLLENDSCRGAYNLVSPQPVSNGIFVDTLAELLHCQCLIPVPAAMAHLAFGAEMANELLLSSTRVVPERLTAQGFQFKNPALKEALEHLLRHRI